jgi:hypothetical protein
MQIEMGIDRLTDSLEQIASRLPEAQVDGAVPLILDEIDALTRASRISVEQSELLQVLILGISVRSTKLSSLASIVPAA